MVFCGKCGFQLTSGNIICPRCGTPTEAGLNVEESQPDSPTIASSSILGLNQSNIGTQETITPDSSMEQQPLILGSNQYNYGTTENMANEATSMMGTQMAGSGQVPTRDSYPGYVPQSAVNVPPQSASYPGYTMQGATTNQQFGVISEDAEKTRARGRIVGLLLILIGLLCILGAMALFILSHNSSASSFSSIHQAHATFAFLSPHGYL
jgi:hypothetical protein